LMQHGTRLPVVIIGLFLASLLKVGTLSGSLSRDARLLLLIHQTVGYHLRYAASTSLSLRNSNYTRFGIDHLGILPVYPYLTPAPYFSLSCHRRPNRTQSYLETGYKTYILIYPCLVICFMPAPDPSGLAVEGARLPRTGVVSSSTEMPPSNCNGFVVGRDHDEGDNSSEAAAAAARPPPRKRRRIVISCTECHRRKQKVGQHFLLFVSIYK